MTVCERERAFKKLDICMELYGHSGNGSQTDQWAAPGQETGLEGSFVSVCV